MEEKESFIIPINFYSVPQTTLRAVEAFTYGNDQPLRSRKTSQSPHCAKTKQVGLLVVSTLTPNLEEMWVVTTQHGRQYENQILTSKL